MGRFLNLLQDVIDVAYINVVLTAHAIIRKFEQPNEMGAYDRYELKLGKKTTAQTAPLTKSGPTWFYLPTTKHSAWL